MIATNVESLCDVVQKNCHISDARHASNFTLCVYLLKMREYYRWEKNYPFSCSVNKDELGSWLSEREQLWETLEDEAYYPLNIDGHALDPFATEEINIRLCSQGLVYSGGLGQGSTPHFFLAELEKRIEHQGFTVMISSHECARGLSAPPAMALGKSIFIRRESLQRMIWEKVQEWRWNQLDNAMARALSHYDFDNDLNQSLEQMTTHELETLILHEIGEIMAGEQLGERWNEMLISLPRSRAEFMARAVRDHLADSLSTLPKMIEQRNSASLDFYMANLTTMRKEIFPGFGVAYESWSNPNRLHALQALIEQSQVHWLNVARKMLQIYDTHGEQCIPHLESMINANRL